MSFKQLYEPCFKNIPLVNLSQQLQANGSNAQERCLTTLGSVFKSSNYVIFFIAQSSSSAFQETIASLQTCLRGRRSKSSSLSSNSSPAKFKRLFGLKKSKKTSLSDEINNYSIVVIDDETNPVDMQMDIDCAVFVMPHSSITYITKGRLLRALRAFHLPCLTVVECQSLSLTTSQGRRMLTEDPNGDAFPWHDPPKSVFSGPILKNVVDPSGNKKFESVDSSSLAHCIKAIYFGAKWCPPCRSLNKQLQTAYEKLRSQCQLPFEIIYCSLDRSEASFEEHFLSMPWLAFPFTSSYLHDLARIYDVNGIPSVILLDEENNLITRHGRSVLLSDPTGKDFPWKNQSIYELNEFTVNRIGDFPSLILFTEGTPEDTEFSIQLLKPFLSIYATNPNSNSPDNDKHGDNLSKKSGNTQSLSNSESSLIESDAILPSNVDHFQFFYTGEDPFCDYILESLGLGQAELPLIIICDVMAGHMAICDKPDVSETILADFINEYRNGRANVVPLPYSNVPETRKVGGIPVNVIEHLICNQQAGTMVTK
uniref:Thioredoxin domain-containing protein n=1 Tax=Acrobeloides nanus TaxID=290746 RepID=A0A914BWY4_9BILA